MVVILLEDQNAYQSSQAMTHSHLLLKQSPSYPYHHSPFQTPLIRPFFGQASEIHLEVVVSTVTTRDTTTVMILSCSEHSDEDDVEDSQDVAVQPFVVPKELIPHPVFEPSDEELQQPSKLLEVILHSKKQNLSSQLPPSCLLPLQPELNTLGAI